jgi:hypothetical protein
VVQDKRKGKYWEEYVEKMGWDERKRPRCEYLIKCIYMLRISVEKLIKAMGLKVKW